MGNESGRKLVEAVLRWIGVLTIVAVVVLGVYGVNRYYDDEPVTYTDVAEHFRHGSTGGERGWKSQFGFGFP